MDYVNTILTFLGENPYTLSGLIFFAAFWDSLFFLGFFTNGTLLMTIAAAAYFKFEISIATVWSCSLVGTFLADQVSFLFGVKTRQTPMLGNLLKNKESSVKKVDSLIQRYGSFGIILGRFNFLTRPIVPFICGVGKMKYLIFLRYDLAACIAWVTFWTAVLLFMEIGYIEFNGIKQ